MVEPRAEASSSTKNGFSSECVDLSKKGFVVFDAVEVSLPSGMSENRPALGDTTAILNPARV